LALVGGFFFATALFAKFRRAFDQPIDEADRRDDEKQDELFHVALGGVC
jgi:cation transport regulator ChaB